MEGKPHPKLAEANRQEAERGRTSGYADRSTVAPEFMSPCGARSLVARV